MQTVAVTGASGLIGTALTAALEGRGDRVIPVEETQNPRQSR